MVRMGLGGNGMLKGNGSGGFNVFASQVTNRCQRTSSHYVGYV